MSLRIQYKLDLENFATHRGININNCKLGDDSVFLRKVLRYKRHQKSLSFNYPYFSVGNTPIRSNRISSKIIKNVSNPNILEINKNNAINKIKKKLFISNNQSKKELISQNEYQNTIVDTSTPFDYTERYTIVDSNKYFNTISKNNYSLFYRTTCNFNKSCEDILKRFNRNKNSNINTPDRNKNKKKYKEIVFTPKDKNMPVKNKTSRNMPKIIYTKKKKSYK